MITLSWNPSLFFKSSLTVLQDKMIYAHKVIKSPRYGQPQNFAFLSFDRVNDRDLYMNWFDFGQFSSWPSPWIFKVKFGIRLSQ